jgi:hypothetical protein
MLIISYICLPDSKFIFILPKIFLSQALYYIQLINSISSFLVILNYGMLNLVLAIYM